MYRGNREKQKTREEETDIKAVFKVYLMLLQSK